jgi:hypothetical protein
MPGFKAGHATPLRMPPRCACHPAAHAIWLCYAVSQLANVSWRIGWVIQD